VSVFGSLHPRFRGVGVGAVACAFVLVTYYSMLLGWVSRASFESWSEEAPWTDENVTGEQAITYFLEEIIGIKTLGDDGKPTTVVGQNVGYSFFCWVCIYLCLVFGMEWTGRIAYFTMGLPIFLLLVFLIRAVTLEGASDGVKVYIGEWDMAVLRERPDVWSTAVSQIFFSIGVTLGTMPAYGSCCPRGEPACVNSMVIGFSNSMFSFLSGFAVFAALGHLAHLQDKDVNEIPYAGFSLVFGTWPVVFGTLPGGIHWVRLLFVNLFLLGIDSAFSILEAPIAVAMDFASIGRQPKWIVRGAFAIVAYLVSLVYATDAGLNFLDVVDFYVNFVFLIIGLFETFGAGWMYGIDKQVDSLGAGPVYAWIFTNFGSVIVACCIWFGQDISKGPAGNGFIALFVIFFAGLGLTLGLLNNKMKQEPGKWTWSTIMYELTLSNVMELRERLEAVVGWMPWAWAFLIKNFIPHVLLILFVNLAASELKPGEPQFGNYGGYDDVPYQLTGIICFCFGAIFMVIGFFVPALFEGADKHLKVEDTTVQAFDEPEGKDIKDVEEVSENEA
jgi:solute carrier family 6 GABA transporter-like protein 1